MKAQKFTNKEVAEQAAEEVMRAGWPASVTGSPRCWFVDAHGYANGKATRINYFLGEDGKLHERNRVNAA